MDGRLILEDGSIFEGEAFGSRGERVGLVVAYSGSTGYQEAITAPPYLGRIIVFRYPTIGNSGVTNDGFESDRVCAEGIVVREVSKSPGGSGAVKSFGEFSRERELLGIEDADTEGIAERIAETGEQWGLLTTKDGTKSSYLKRLAELKYPIGGNPDNYRVSGEALLAPWRPGPDNKTVVVLDLGAGKTFYSLLQRDNWFWRAFGPKMTAEEILHIKPAAVIISNGSYAPESLGTTVNTVKSLLGKLPVFGVGLGCVVLGAALGMKPVRMKCGHHGLNCGVREEATGRCMMTAQRHSFNLDEKGMGGAGVKALFRNIDDGSLEGISCAKKRAAGVLFVRRDLSALEKLIG